MKLTRKALLLMVVLSLTISVLAQRQPPPKQPPNTGADQFEKAHQGIFAPQADKARKAGRLAEKVSRVLPPGDGSAGRVPQKNYVDEYIFARIERDGIPHAGVSTDEEFIRRVYIDATGLLPPVGVVREFLASREPEKRDKLIDRLIGSEEFAEQWAWFYCDLFRVNSWTGDGKIAFNSWLKQWFRTDRPYNEVVTDLLVPSSKSHSTIPSMGFLGRIAANNLKSKINTDPDNYFMINRLDTIDEINVEMSRVFLGLNVECVSCHDGAGHLEGVNLYLAQKEREDFQRQSAFFGKLTTITYFEGATNLVNDFIMTEEAHGYDTGNDAPYVTASEARFPRSGKTYEPAFFLTGERPKPGAHLRRELARMLTEHTQFSRAAVNMIWAKLMTIGFVEPFDAFDLARMDPKNAPPKPWTVQPTYPELLEAMASDFKANGYSMHHLFKTIMKSNAYQLSSSFPVEWKDDYSQYYSRHLARMMRAPEVVDAIAQATGRPGSYTLSGVNMTRVKQLTGPEDLAGRGPNAAEAGDIRAIMQSFFQTNRFAPAPVGNMASTLQTMLLMVSGSVNDRVLAEKDGTVQLLVESDKADSEIVNVLFLGALSRFPIDAEKDVALAALAANRKRGAENLLWALLNTPEFVLNH